MAIPLLAAVSGASLVVLVVLVVTLVRRMGGLAESIAGFHSDLRPILEEIRGDAARAREDASRLAERSREQRRAGAPPGER